MTNKLIRLLIVCFVVVIGITVFYSLHILSLSATINVNAVPLESKITINDRVAKAGNNRVAPGSKNISVSLPGFNTINQTVVVQKGSYKTLDIVLTSNSSSTANWYFTHPKDAKAVEGISDKQVDALSKQAVQEAPLIKLLPFVAGGLEFRVDYGNVAGANAAQPIVYITAATSQAQQAGLAWIKSLGFNPSDYNVKLVTGPVQPLSP